ncbi:2'-5' RNA ligase family protein [Luteococcus sp. Sow4_B9]|uniref:2'-5' RNA ligase family protein n=1 Tax=Luteococcus sp. Sow4_B9 TaxID=3438792 RepID=UPI003F9990CD
MTSALPQESSLLLVVPEAEPAVHEHRARFDLAARVGVPAHITVAYPFKPFDVMSPDDLARLRDLFRAAAPFQVDLRSTGWFGEDVLFLEPQDPAPIIELTRRVEAAFPEHPIYGGVFDGIRPHLTVGHDCGVETLRQIEDSVAPLLPITHQATAIQLWSGPALSTRQTGWQLVDTFPLGT